MRYLKIDNVFVDNDWILFCVPILRINLRAKNGHALILSNHLV